jgi:hypothetical protein
MFRQLSSSAYTEYQARVKSSGDQLVFGVDFLDSALRGICKDDLILLGAPSGVGKTQLCCNIALANMANGKKVHYIALEASEFEIDRRLKYPLVAERYYADPLRQPLPVKLNYTDWLLGKFVVELQNYEMDAAKYFESAYGDLFVHYKGDNFGLKEFIDAVLYCAKDTDLIIVDHVHYFDLDDDNENRAMKAIAKTVRSLAIEEQKPIIMVAHLRKRDRHNDDLCAGMEEFHGSSDLFKIATKVITVAPGKPTQDGLFETFFRIPKNRNDQGPTKFLAREFFSPKKGGYEKDRYQLGWADQKRSVGFELLDQTYWPDWARRSRDSSNSSSVSTGKFTYQPPRRTGNHARSIVPD